MDAELAKKIPVGGAMEVSHTDFFALLAPSFPGVEDPSPEPGELDRTFLEPD